MSARREASMNPPSSRKLTLNMLIVFSSIIQRSSKVYLAGCRARRGLPPKAKVHGG
ncbi:MAG: hypothetical protein QXD19_05990 [Candidatus Bathyarchaeia archaeon]